MPEPLSLSDAVLRFTYPKGKTVTYDVRKSFKEVEGDYDTVYLEEWVFTFQEALAGGAAKLKVDRTLVAMEVDGKTIKLTPATNTDIESHTPRGEVRGRTPWNQIEPLLELRLLRIGDLNYPPTPVTNGTKWQVDAAATDDGFPAATWTWSFDTFAEGNVSGVFNFEEKSIDAPIHAQGKFTASLGDGWLTELTFKADNTHLLGDEEKTPTIYTLSMKRR